MQQRVASLYSDHGTGKEQAGQVVFTDGTVFILAENQAAGDSSLVEAGVTSCRALWHVKKPGDHRSRAARDGREEADG
jgi:hypothetical protein